MRALSNLLCVMCEESCYFVHSFCFYFLFHDNNHHLFSPTFFLLRVPPDTKSIATFFFGTQKITSRQSSLRLVSPSNHMTTIHHRTSCTQKMMLGTARASPCRCPVLKKVSAPNNYLKKERKKTPLKGGGGAARLKVHCDPSVAWIIWYCCCCCCIEVMIRVE